MKKILFLLFFPVTVFGQYTSIPDSIFEQRLIDFGYDTIHDGQVLTLNIVNVDSLTFDVPPGFGAPAGIHQIKDFTGIEDFVSLTYLDCSGNDMDTLDLSQNTALTYLDCSGWIGLFAGTGSELSSLNISQNTSLTHLIYASQTLLANFDVSQHTDLIYLNCSQNNISSLDVSQNTSLTHLYCRINNLSSIDLSQNSALTTLDCSSNNLSSIDLSQNTSLTHLYCSSNNLSSIDVSQNTSLTDLYCRINNLSSIDLSQNSALTTLGCYNNILSSLDVSQNTSLTNLFCYNNNLSSIDVSQNSALITLDCSSNNLSSIDVSQNSALTTLDCSSNNLSSIDVSQITDLIALRCSDNNLSSIDVSQNTGLTQLLCYDNNLLSLDLRNGNNINFVNVITSGNDSLFCISVDDSAWSANNWSSNFLVTFDSHTVFSNDCNPSSVDIIENLNNFLIYPNPTRQDITISIENFNGNIQTEVYDLVGNRLQTTNETTISLRDYSKGIYILKVAYGDRVQEVKVIKE